MSEQGLCRDNKNVMGDMNAKIGVGTNGRQKLIVRHGVSAEMNGNSGRWNTVPAKELSQKDIDFTRW